MIKAKPLFVKHFLLTVFTIESLTKTNGDKEIRTLDPLLARQVLSQLSYIPSVSVVVFPYLYTQIYGLKWIFPLPKNIQWA